MIFFSATCAAQIRKGEGEKVRARPRSPARGGWPAGWAGGRGWGEAGWHVDRRALEVLARDEGLLHLRHRGGGALRLGPVRLGLANTPGVTHGVCMGWVGVGGGGGAPRRKPR
jgi:hypothetical protein